ncbi:geranylgeranyl transferase type-2 subunit alpha isoform X2 [Rhinatrema bivittatum]|uniref:geranylgeranyl transferase type-2 subunit alpha isoform X2 n=1 Tax=Rhinatrema bivittatum TaxID=194408 RepID=UPI00112DF2EE|nr:geranylgeranyl transferase type-2 subunit alpha isoform X2 [Rhinatrema bivittatum]
MHGRLKVKTTEEQQEAKRKEREKKLQLYTATTSTIFQKRESQELDQEVLELTNQILGANPDFATLWNFRREIFLHLEKEKSEDELQSLYTGELFHLDSCLRVNPKSYGSWHHRCWVLERMPQPDWSRELELCSRFLELDERNFHCWDYRRFVAHRSEVPAEEELAFTHGLITRNFSNYSSWHYRSKLLPLIHPDPQRQGRVTEEVLLRELELAQNAFFTDPSDQSAWLYHRWLLGRVDRDVSLLCVFISREGGWLSVGFSHPVIVRAGSDDLLLFLDGTPLMVSWLSVDRKNRSSYLWLCDLPPGSLGDLCPHHTFRVLWKDGAAHKECFLYRGQQESWNRDSATEEQIFRCELSVEKSTVLQSELESCKELQELEPENKWCLLTIILLMRALDPLGYEKETLSYFQTLKAADPMRCAYFNDLLSKFLMENCILKMEYAESRVIDLSRKGLTALYHEEHLLLVTHMSLSANQLRALPRTLAMLRCLEVLEADDNVIESLEGLSHLPKLEEVSLRNNRINRISDLRPLASCPRLSLVNLQGNPVCGSPDVRSELALLLPHVLNVLT